jgi:hypothetical protein
LSKAGVIEEMVGDTMDSLDDPDMEDAADEEVCRVLAHSHAPPPFSTSTSIHY